MTAVRYCILCASDTIATKAEDRFVISVCDTCGAVVRFEFDPPDDPSLRGRIEVLVEPDAERAAAPPARAESHRSIH